ncbi:ribulokinase [Dysgonomonas sp. Marseille-P4677]|uniref:ribulokinase n=1 Tax=Dysgonomonas sp. Marseille-P4677 TaxID=2364790 RepID=UPI001911E3E7|nr:ribulokinase [Dysgonomonas sp. Marseille-P4677]MBK5720612.1 ribulokinase [Dysgonomonas sp. Marseille-P4677]
MSKKYVIGVDYGTDSCRAVIIDTDDGKEIASSVQYYPQWKEGLYCNPQENQYRQHPQDYIDTLEAAIKDSLMEVENDISKEIIGISFDMTASTPVLVDKDGTPLALLEEYKKNPNAMFILWKDHTAISESIEINQLSKKWDIDFTAYEGGIYSAEWVWSKVLHVLRVDESIRSKAYSWIEHTDWMPALLTGNTKPENVMRSRCVGGHKAMWHEKWGGLPSEEFLTELSPLLKGFRSHLYEKTYTSDVSAGKLTAEWAARLGLTTDVEVGIGAIDCHMGAVGAGIKPGSFVRVMGTSTCDIMTVPYDQMEDMLIPGICGQVDGSVIPGFIGLEAGQSAFGDLYAWFRGLLEWPLHNILMNSKLLDENIKAKLIEEVSDTIIPQLSDDAVKISIEQSTIIATDWMNGRRTPDANQLLTGSITGLTLGSNAPLIFRALVEATAFGSKSIIDRFLDSGIEIKEVIGIGGISQKSPFVMQILSDVIGLPIKVARSQQTCALGAAMFAAVIAGKYNTIEEAQLKMGQGFICEYTPDMKKHEKYKVLYDKYLHIGQFTEACLPKD